MAGGIIASIAGALLPDLGPTIGKVLDRIIPDPVAAAKAQTELTAALADREATLLKIAAEGAKAQTDLNAAEAQSPSIFVAGWRPACAWICVFGFLYSFVLAPMLTWSAFILGVALGIAFPAPPTLDTASLTTLLLGMLGLGTLRMTEKLNGVASANMSSPMGGTISNPPPARRGR